MMINDAKECIRNEKGETLEDKEGKGSVCWR
jgi:hypothetical protein